MAQLPRLYAITDSKLYGDRWEEILLRLMERGVRMIQLREKDISASQYYQKALKVREITARYGALLFINDRVDIAMAVEADGVHLPSSGLPPSVVKKLSPKLLVGFSAHNMEEALQAEREGADFITLSPIFPTRSHPNAEPVGLKTLAEVSRAVSIPVYALGGVTWDKLKLCYKNGAYGVAGISLFLEE
ncbi:Thiamine-phosphate diphosphorylase [Thermocrinis albus DSM 14484]|uniref:Thiamine-phosphate synthase n=1 Tax=Thermocrinis albus (strain DSM 14484 / JCM 11386 / HI 11/12) TaxID=638303 RepID=D3SNR5_THEAH|nr:thiamine phosphate synthase [Thermocrinis albus]ADC88802.1 Thiamine-phosphate diphosphorylase [Thermocrinis albus DSM 14484]